MQKFLHPAGGDGRLVGADVPGHDALVDFVDLGEQGDHAVEVAEGATHGGERRG